MSSGPEHIRVSEHDGVTTIELDRPPLNILHLPMLEEILDAVGEVSASRPRALVIRSSGSVFSAGLDVSEYAEARTPQMIDTYHNIFRRLITADFPIIAVIQGPCLGAGLELASIADFALAGEDAELGLPEITLGLFPPVATMLLPRLIGIPAANELILTGRRVAAAEAWDMGLLYKVVDNAELDDELTTLLTALTSNSNAVMHVTKKAMYGRFRTRFMEELAELEAMYHADLGSLEDTKEGIAAFLGKRAPVWNHR